MSDADTACRLYLITPDRIDNLEAFAIQLTAALEGGDVACVQLRLKGADDAQILATAAALMPICHARDVAFLINDRADLAKQAGADGVHLGQNDGSIADARALLGDEASIGVTCHASLHLAYEAGEAGADYVAFGAFYPSATKETEHQASSDLLDAWDEATELPCVAIGGITPDNCAVLAEAGAHFVAVSGAVWSHPEGPTAAVKAFNMALAS